jgi:hypothetical protein
MTMAKLMGSMRYDPLGCVGASYPWGKPGPLQHRKGPEPWQADLLGYIGDELVKGTSPILVAVASGHGIGKSAEMAWLRQWAMSTLPDTRGMVTANTGQQLKTKTMPEFAKWHALAINGGWFDSDLLSYRYRLEPEHRETWRFDAVTWSKEKPEAFAGLHNYGRRILVEFDEASIIAPIIWETTEGALTDENTEIIWCAFGNPTVNSGRFYECFHKGRTRWKTWQIDAREVSSTNKEQFERWAREYAGGEDSDFFRVRVRGVFPRSAPMQFIGHDVVEEACSRPAHSGLQDPLIMGVDVARYGDDQSVISFRRGRDAKSFSWLNFRGLDTMQLAALVAEIDEGSHYTNLLRPDAIFVDGAGIGGPVVDRIRQLGVACIEVNGGSKAGRENEFADLNAEMWRKMRDDLEAGLAIPDNQELRDDLTGRQYGFDARNRLRLESKDDMKLRGQASPDWADALAFTYAYPVAKRQAPRLGGKAARSWDYDPMEAA